MLRTIVNPPDLRRRRWRFAGVETIGSIMISKEAIPYYPNLKPEMVRRVSHPSEVRSSRTGEELAAIPARKLAERGVEFIQHQGKG
jgi:hypothetical protein